MTWFRVGGAGIPASLKNNMNSVLNKKFGTTGQNYPPNGWPDDVNLLGPLPEKTVAGVIAYTDDAADTVPVKSLICSIVPKQAGSGTPSPTNIRALSGYSSVTVRNVPGNWWDEEWELGVWNTSGEKVANNNTIRSKNYIALKPNQTYFVYGDWSLYSNGLIFRILDAEKSFKRTFIASSLNTTLTLASDECYVVICTFASNNVTTYNNNIAINYPSTKTTYTPYVTPETISDSWSSIGTILGGERNLSDGTLKSDMMKDTMTYSYLSGLSSDYIGYVSSVSAMNNHPCVWVRNWNYSLMPTFRSGGIKSAINSFPGVSINNSSIISIQYRVYIDVNGLNITSVQDFLDTVQTMEQNGDQLEIAFELISPTSYSGLSTYDFETLYAVNNFYSDIEGGQTQVTYRQDIALALAALQGSRSLSASLMRSSGPEEVSEPEENIQNTEEEQEGENDAR